MNFEDLPLGDVTLPEIIVCSANQYTTGKGRIVFIGIRHCDEFMMSDISMHDNLPFENEIQGFWTNKHRFVDRQEAWIIAKDQGQIRRRVGGDTLNGGTLFSENLY